MQIAKVFIYSSAVSSGRASKIFQLG